MAKFEIVEGWTGPLDFQLLADGVAQDLTGMTVELVMVDKDSATVDTVGDISLLDAATGKVRYDPDPPDLVAAKSPYRSRFKVIDGAGKIVYFPSGVAPDRWSIGKAV